MSFAAEVRSELAAESPPSPCCMRAQGYGMLLGAEVAPGRIRLATESAGAAKRFALLLGGLCRAAVEVSVTGAGYLAGADEDAGRVFDYFYIDPAALQRRLSRANIEEECCPAAFLRGLFLAAGYVTAPGKGYRLEFVTRHRRLADDLVTLLSEQGFAPAVASRRGVRVVYFKSGEAVERLLTYMGADRAAAAVGEARLRRAVVNHVNRQMNTDAANLQKSLDAADRQVAAIQRLRSEGRLEFLPDDLLEIALLREQNPDATLGYLAELSGLARSTVNRRLIRLRSLAGDADIQSLRKG